jgi:hypothetical protein
MPLETVSLQPRLPKDFKYAGDTLAAQKEAESLSRKAGILGMYKLWGTQPYANPKDANYVSQQSILGGETDLASVQAKYKAAADRAQALGKRDTAGVTMERDQSPVERQRDQWIKEAQARQGGGASGGIGSNPFGGGTMQPRSVQTQMFNRPAYQRNRVTTGQMGEMNRSNQDRFRSEVKPLTTAFNRNFNQAQAQQQFADTAASDQNSNQFFGLTNQYNQQQNAMNQQMLMPMLSQLFGGF